VREFLEFFAEAFHIPSQRQSAAVEQALEDSGLGARAESFVEELSFGMKQRLFLAKTLLHSPQLLLDEPATGLDPLARVDLRDQLKRLNQQGITILLSSHILADLQEICSRVALIAGGTNQEDAGGSSVIELRHQDASQPRLFEVGVLRDGERARQLTSGLPGVKVLHADPLRIVVEISGDAAQAPEFLRHLVVSGIQVVRFDRPPATLEQRYRETFGEKPR
jgi:ABC-2 type transport system ATP-binding protein